MTIESDLRFWDQKAESYSKSPVSDEAGYQRTLKETGKLLKPADSVLELGCGTGSTALHLAGGVSHFLGTDISPEMIKIANAKHAARVPGPIEGLVFRTETVESLSAASPGPSKSEIEEHPESGQRFDAVLGFNYLHLVHDLPAVLSAIHGMITDGGLFISKTPCVGEMNIAVRCAIPVMRAVGKAPHALLFREAELAESIQRAGFEIVRNEKHASKGNDKRPFIVARKQ